MFQIMNSSSPGTTVTILDCPPSGLASVDYRRSVGLSEGPNNQYVLSKIGNDILDEPAIRTVARLKPCFIDSSCDFSLSQIRDCIVSPSEIKLYERWIKLYTGDSATYHDRQAQRSELLCAFLESVIRRKLESQ